MPGKRHDNYDHLSPELVIQAVESLGYLSDARIFPLNSYENRVYQVGIEEQTPLIAKFYRPNRWSDEQILEEHQFSQMLNQLDLPVIDPICCNGQTLHEFAGYRFSISPRMGGQAPEPGDFDQLYRLGRLIGRIHAAGKEKDFSHRTHLSIDTYCTTASQFLLNNQFIPNHLVATFEQLIEELTSQLEAQFAAVDNLQSIRTHGDCHISNILWNRDSGPWFVDFDDCIMAPAVQDLWMLLEGDRRSQTAQLAELLEGYEEFCDFNRAEIALIESLRSMRIVHYAGWLAKRWSDPAFPKNFPWFNTPHYWETLIGEIQEQLLLLNEEPIKLF
ncbi:MAG: serine/threonine protein kinase [Gammaproteobacteria bacterium]|nr:MAG: serine/threonine protein kinase [Gammaproteobacteria bacterium]